MSVLTGPYGVFAVVNACLFYRTVGTIGDLRRL